ncbi:MAG: CBO0543 family protein [Neobacillus sp.]
MSKEVSILAFSWIICLITLYWVSKGRARLTQITFLFSQALSWLFEFILVYFELVEFPYREFRIATNMSFSLYYLIFPTVGVLFILLYPKQSSILKVLLYYLLFSMVIPTYSLLAERYSNLLQFINWNWGIHVLADLVMFYILKNFIVWFQRGIKT